MSWEFHQDLQAANRCNFVTVFSATLKISEISYFTSWFLMWFWSWSKLSSCSCLYVVHDQQCFMLFLFLWIVCLWFILWIVYWRAIVDSLLLFIQSEQAVKNDLHEILLSKLMCLFLLLCMILMFFVCILLI